MCHTTKQDKSISCEIIQYLHKPAALHAFLYCTIYSLTNISLQFVKLSILQFTRMPYTASYTSCASVNCMLQQLEQPETNNTPHTPRMI